MTMQCPTCQSKYVFERRLLEPDKNPWCADPWHDAQPTPVPSAAPPCPVVESQSTTVNYEADPEPELCPTCHGYHLGGCHKQGAAPAGTEPPALQAQDWIGFHYSLGFKITDLRKMLTKEMQAYGDYRAALAARSAPSPSMNVGRVRCARCGELLSPAPRWIPVEEKLPEVGREVPAGAHITAKFMDGKVTRNFQWDNMIFDGSKWRNSYSGEEDFPTHWFDMPLPAAPAGPEEEK